MHVIVAEITVSLSSMTLTGHTIPHVWRNLFPRGARAGAHAMLFFDLVLLAGSPCWCSRLVLQGGSLAGSPGWFSPLVFQAVSFGWVFRLVLPVGSPGWFSRLVALAGSPGWFSRLVLSVVSSCWFSRLVSPAGSPGWCSQLVLLFIFLGWELTF